MSWYEFLLFAHISMAAIWVGGSTMMQFFGLRAIKVPDPMRLIQVGQDIEWIGNRVLIPASAFAVVTGILLVIDSDFWGFGDDWIVIGLVLFAVTFLTGAAFLGPESGRIAKMVALHGAGSPGARLRIRRILILSRIDLVVLFLIIFDMSVKPSFDDAGWLIAAVLVAAAIAAAVTVPAMRVRPA